MVISIGHMHFKVIENYRDAFDQEQFAEKYSEVLNKYDYIVGDIGYEKLRMSGFYRDNKAKVDRDKKFSAIEDYISEYCNFGCAYFIMEKLSKEDVKQLKDEGVVFTELEIGGSSGTEDDGADDEVGIDSSAEVESGGGASAGNAKTGTGGSSRKSPSDGYGERGRRGSGDRSRGQHENRGKSQSQSGAPKSGDSKNGKRRPRRRKPKSDVRQNSNDNANSNANANQSAKKSNNRTLSSFQND